MLAEDGVSVRAVQHHERAVSDGSLLATIVPKAFIVWDDDQTWARFCGGAGMATADFFCKMTLATGVQWHHESLKH
ncbi:unnamed protein product [Amoebophrya sp. A120]|nr:unnamed protein product [Amoebophrya sp. A120]|eukprot:GSA120T00000719001.1